MPTLENDAQQQWLELKPKNCIKLKKNKKKLLSSNKVTKMGEHIDRQFENMFELNTNAYRNWNALKSSVYWE